MTVVRPNSISGITSITAQTDTINFFKSDGSLAGLLLNGTNFNTTTGVSTFNILKVGTATTLDSSGINITGVVTATSFRGDGSNLTGVAATSNIRTNAIVNSGVTTVSAGSASIPSISPSGNASCGIFFPTTDTIAFTEGGVEAVRIDSNGRLGIGTTSPTHLLELKTTSASIFKIVATSELGVPLIVAANSNTVTPTNQFFVAHNLEEVNIGNARAAALTLHTGNTERVRINSSGGVGIGTIDPSNTMLQVVGNHVGGHSIVKIQRNNDQISSLGFYSQSKNRDVIIYGANDGSFNVESFGHIQFTTNNSTEKLRILNNGNVGIGLTTPTSKLQVTGDVSISGVGTATEFVSTSDITLKENITVIDNPLIKLSELRGVTFDWKKGGSSVGVIAQDVEKVLPQAVRGEENNKAVNYNGIIGLLVESIKQQQKEIDELKSRLNK